MITTSRRAVLAGAASLPALSVPALASTEGAISFPELAARFAAIYQRWLDQMTSDLAGLGEYRAAMSKATGMTWKEWDAGWTIDMDQKLRDERHAISMAVHDTLPDHDPCNEIGQSIAWNEIHDEMHELIREILDQPTRSLADLKLQIRAFALSESQIWLDGHDDGQITQTKQIMDVLCRFIGLDPLPGAAHLVGVYA